MDAKRRQVNAARTIPTQSAEAALKDGEIDLQAFLAAREFEIAALEQSMATSKAVSASRAFQQVPRGLRRRTASHNPKRVPRRLQARARKEMADDNTPIVESRKRKPRTSRARIRAETAKRLGLLAKRREARNQKAKEASQKAGEDTEMTLGEPNIVSRKPRPKLRRNVLNEPPRPVSKFRKRQKNKTWLPTHIWHAKRSRMTPPSDPLWGFAVPLTPNEKIYRPTHRAQGDRGAIVWDTSYHSTIGLTGNLTGIERVLRRLGVTKASYWNAKGQKWRAGSRSATVTLTRTSSGGTRVVCPAQVFWNPSETLQDKTGSVVNPFKDQCQVIIRVHASAFKELFEELVRLTKMEKPRLHVEDLRYEIGSIELTGPASTEVLHSVLSPIESSSPAHVRLFRSIQGLTNPASLPANAMLGFSVQDPRLRQPKRPLNTQIDGEARELMLTSLAEWPAEEGLGPYSLLDRNFRHTMAELPSQKVVNRTLGALAPGTQPKLKKSDPRVPLILLSSRPNARSRAQGSWTLLAPWSCIQPLWHTIVRCPLSSGANPRHGGLNEMMQVAFERDQPWFPGDWPATNAGVEWELSQRRKRKVQWDKKPKSRRPEWTTLDLGAGRKGELGNGQACDYEFLFGKQIDDRQHVESQATTDSDAMVIDHEGEDTSVSKATSDSDPLLKLHAISKTHFDELLSATSPAETPPTSLLSVKLRLLSRGVAKPCARIYRLPNTHTTRPPASSAEVPASIPPQASPPELPSDLRAQWLARIPTASNPSTRRATNSTQMTSLDNRKRALAKELVQPPRLNLAADTTPQGNQLDMSGHPLVPDADDLIGFVSSGAFSLSGGRGQAVGSLAVDKIVDGLRASRREGHLCIVRNAGESVGWLAKWEPM